MRLHNRQIKASFWTDPDILQWPREKRWFYMGLVQLADDSGCLEDSPFAFKIQLFPSPVDADITTDVIEKWCEGLIEAGKLVRYEAIGKPCLYIRNFHKHQTLKNCPAPDVPLPPWLQWEPFKSNDRNGKYVVDESVLTNFLQGSYALLTDDLQPSSNQNQNLTGTRTGTQQEPEGGPGETGQPPQPEASAECCLAPDPEDGEKSNGDKGSQGPGTKSKSKPKRKAKNPEYTAEFEQFWQAYPQGRRLDKFAAFKNWCSRLKEGLAPGDLVRAASNYATNCRAENTETKFIMRPTTFLGPNRRWESWLTWVPSQARDGPKLAPNTRNALALVEKYRQLEEMQGDQSGNSDAIGTYGSGVAEI